MMKYQVYRKPTLADCFVVANDMPADEREQWEAFTGTPYSTDAGALYLANKVGPQWVLCADGQAVSIAGFDYIRPGVWQDYQLNTTEAYGRHWRATVRACRKGMDAMIKDAHRLQCVSLASRVGAHRLYAAFGLAPEGTLKGYGANGEDAIMFSRVRNGYELGRAGTTGCPAARD